jgi:hypothetical protein
MVTVITYRMACNNRLTSLCADHAPGMTGRLSTVEHGAHVGSCDVCGRDDDEDLTRHGVRSPSVDAQAQRLVDAGIIGVHWVALNTVKAIDGMSRDRAITYFRCNDFSREYAERVLDALGVVS